MKKLLVVSAIAALGLTSMAFAGGLPEEMPTAPTAGGSDNGVYMGLAGGFGMTNWKNLIDKIDNDNGFVGRAFLGYDISRYLAVELGYTYFFNKPSIDTTNAGVTKSIDFVKRTHAIDLMGKIKAPIVDNFDLYGKIGANYLMTGFEATGSDSTNNFNVAFGAGADYYITPNIIANVEWLRFNGKAKIDKDYQPSTDAFLLGLRYKFDI